MRANFRASESVEIAVPAKKIPIHEYLRQPQHLVKAIADPQRLQQLSSSRFEFRMGPLRFMELYCFQPIVTLKIWSDPQSTVYIEAEDCRVKGLESLIKQFQLNFSGYLTPYPSDRSTCLRGSGDLRVSVEVPPPLWLTPQPLLEMAGNGLLQTVFCRIKARLMAQLLIDYEQWCLTQSQLMQPVN